MTLILGLLIGAGVASYTIISSTALGLAFPTIQGDIAARPTFFRLIQFLGGRLLGWLIISTVINLFAQYIHNPIVNRIFVVINLFFGIFIILYLFTEESPDIVLARKTDVSKMHLPVFVLGLFSSFLFIAPNYSAIVWAFSQYKLQTIYIFFTNIFIGYSVLIIPFLMNKQWIRTPLFHYITRIFLFICGATVLLLSVRELLKS